MNLEVLALIDDDHIAQRMIVSWPQVGGLDLTNDERDHRWSSIAMVDIDDVRKRLSMLFDNGILGPGGSVEPDAAELVRRRIEYKLGRTKRKRRTPDDDED